MIGLLYVILAQTMWVSELILIRKYLPHMSPFLIAGITTVISNIFFIPGIYILKPKLSQKEFLILFILGFLSIFLAQFIYTKGIQKAPSTFLVSLVGLNFPFLVAIGGWLFLNETISPRELIGGLIMVIGFLIVSLPK